MGNCKTVCIDRCINNKVINLESMTYENINHEDVKTPLEDINYSLIEKYNKQIIQTSNIILSNNFYNNFIQNKDIEECIRICIKDLSSKNIFLLIDFICENLFMSKDINNNDILYIFKISLRSIKNELNVHILPITSSLNYIKVHLLSVLHNLVEIFHFLRLRNGLDGRYFLNRPYLY